jgi:predicted Rossmann fold flavoprotein
MRVAVIGGGAAGFFAASACATRYPQAEVFLFERTDKPLAKVRISGGGRCNVTTAITAPNELVKHYPRGGRAIKPLLHRFGPKETVDWFKARGVELKSEPDGRMFPTTDDSQTIIECLAREVLKLRIGLRYNARVEALSPTETGLQLTINGSNEHFDHVIVATGGSPKAEGLAWLAELGHEVIEPVPSLFTFNLNDDPIVQLTGLSAPRATVRLSGSDLHATGPVLVTHWGFSGPAVLRLSSLAARWLAQRDYQAEVVVNWTGIGNEEEVRAALNAHKAQHHRALAKGSNPFQLPARLWEHLCAQVGMSPMMPFAELGGKLLNRLVNTLMNDSHTLCGKTTFKEEFVTCGGISLDSVYMHTMQSRAVPRLYFAGEVLDIDGVTGGFNFQAAWTTGYVSGQLGAT